MGVCSVASRGCRSWEAEAPDCLATRRCVSFYESLPQVCCSSLWCHMKVSGLCSFFTCVLEHMRVCDVMLECSKPSPV